MRYKPKSMAALQLRLVACRIKCGLKWTRTSKYQQRPSASFRKVTAWPENLAIATPHVAEVIERTNINLPICH